jgi:predicted ArsR family transcriptional regulator
MQKGQNQAHPERKGATPVPDQPPAAVGTPGNPLRLTDARMMRALAHPARIAIWQHLGLDGPATATECAQVAGLSPSACSYHLRTLARYGIVEEDRTSSTDGRERPWRVKLFAVTVDDGADVPPAVLEAGRRLSASVFATAEELREGYRDRESEYPADWRTALGTNYDVLHATPDELVTLQQRIVELLGEYRRLSRDERPPGARRVQVTVGLTPWFPPPGEPETADEPE